MPPDRLGEYLRGFDALLRDAGLDGVPYGHFGDGCVHVRIDFPLDRRGGRPASGRSSRRPRTDRGARRQPLRRARRRPGPLGPAAPHVLPEVIVLFAAVKGIFDPDNLLNPGVLVDPRPVDADIRLAARLREPRRTLRLAHDGGSVVAAVHRCTGVGKCVADNTGTGGVMCPSYLATRDEKDSTRGRARVLQEMVNGWLVATGGAPTRCTRRSTCAWRARAAPPTARPASTWRPTRRRRCTTLPPPAPAAQPLRAGAAAAVGPARAAGRPARERRSCGRSGPRLAKAAAGIDQRRPDRSPGGRSRWAGAPSGDGPGARTTSWCGRTRSPTGSPPTPAGPPSRCSRPPACGSAWSPSRPAAG